MPSVWRRSLPRNALSSVRRGPAPAPRLGHRGAGCRRLWTPSRLLAETARAGSLFARPAASGRHASLGPRRRSPTSATDYDARAHPTSCRSSHASGAFAPLHAGTNRCQLRWPPPMRCRTVGLRAASCHAPAFARRVPLARKKQVTGRDTRAKASRALLTMSRVPSSWCPGHPGRRFDSSLGLDDPALPRPGLDSPRMRPREGTHRRKNRGAFCCDGTLTRARDCSLVRAWTAAPSRCLQWRLCSRARAPLLPPLSGALF